MNKEELEPIPLDEKKKKSMVTRIIVSFVLAAVGLPALFFGGWLYFAFITFFFVVAIHEFIRATGKKYPWYVYVITYVFTISFCYWTFIKNNLVAYRADPSGYAFSLEFGFSEPGVSWYAIILLLGIYFVIGIFNREFKIDDISYLFMMSILVGLGFQCFLFLRYCPFSANLGGPANPDNVFRWVSSAMLFLFVTVATFGNDIMAYFVGVFFGRHKMKSGVSPNKSWEGFFGGWLLGGLMAFGFCSSNGR